MGRKAGVPNKVTTEVKEKLQVVLDDVVSSLNIDEMTTDQKIKMLQLGLQYLLPKLKHTSGDRDKTDYPLFMTPGDLLLLTFIAEMKIQENLKLRGQN